MTERFDVVVMGMGPAGEVAASRLLSQGLRVAVIERELIGGECAYWACIPSKTLLGPPEARAEARRAAGLAEPEQNWPEVAAYRDFMIRNLDDSKQISGYEADGAKVFKGKARITGSGRVEVAGQTVQTDRIIIATGSDPHIPATPGLQEAGYWTNREATTLSELPASVAILGGGPVGVELGQLYARLGIQVTLIQSPIASSIARSPASRAALDALRDDGIDVRVGSAVERVHGDPHGPILTLTDGARITAERIIVATGRRARVHDLGLDTLGIEPGPRGIVVDERCRAGGGVWAIGDVTGVMPFIHVGMYQGRIAAADIAGREVRADYGAIPRVVFSDPEIAAVGMTAPRLPNAASTSPPPRSNSPRRSPARGPTNANRAARSGYSPTAGAACLSEPGRSLPWPENGSTTPRWRSRRRSRSRSSPTPSPSFPPTPRDTSKDSSSST